MKQLSFRQQEILDKSIILISNKGIQGFTIKNLSKSVGISEPALYRHFESKTKILETILGQFEELADFFANMIEESNMPAKEKISFMFEKMVDIFINNPAIISIIFSEEIFKNDDHLKEIIVRIMNINEKTVENIILSGQNTAEIRDDIDEKTMALVVMGALRLMVKRWDLNDRVFDLKKEGLKLIDSLRLLLQKE
jgi:AcrR family transcriptional regulator